MKLKGGKAFFLGGDLFWSMLLAYRVCWFMGRYGAGKTSLAVMCAGRLLAEKRVEKIVGNFPMSFSDTLGPLEVKGESVLSLSDYHVIDAILHHADFNFSPLLNAGIVIDEAWNFVENRQATLDYAGFVRKFEHYLLLPSVFPINVRLSYFYVQRVFNAYSLGLPLWFYKWNINNRGVKDDGYFAIANPHAVFGHYPTDFVPGDDGNISDHLLATAIYNGYRGTRSRQMKKGKKNEISERESSIFEELETMEDISAQIEESTDSLHHSARKIRRARI